MQEDLCLTGKKKMADFTVNCKICHLQLYIRSGKCQKEVSAKSDNRESGPIERKVKNGKKRT